MFLQIVNIYLIFEHSHQKPTSFGNKINLDLVATFVEVKIHIYDPYLPHLDWTQWGNVEQQPFITPKESKTDWGNDGPRVKTE